MTQQPRSILAIDSTSFGRSLPVIPALKMIRGERPDTFIAAAVNGGISELLSRLDLVDEIIDLGAIAPSHAGAIAKVKRSARLASRARKHDFDLALDFSAVGELQFLTRFFLQTKTIAPLTVGLFIDNLLGRRARLSGDFKLNYTSVLRQVGIKVEDFHLGVELAGEDNQRFEKLLEKSGSRGGEPIVVIHSEMDRNRACWPVERFADLSTRLASNLGARIIAADEPQLGEFTDSVFGLLPRGSIKIPSPHAIDLLAAIARASLFVTDSRGLAWAGVEMGTPVLEVAESRAGIRPEAKTHRVISASSLMRLMADEAYREACEMLTENRSSILFQR